MIIRDYREYAFSLFINDYFDRATSFKAIYDFLYKYYFPYIAFSPIYLMEKKIWVFELSLKMVGFEGSVDGIRLLVRYKDKIWD